MLDGCFCEYGVDDGENGGNDFRVGGYLIAAGGKIEGYCRERVVGCETVAEGCVEAGRGFWGDCNRYECDYILIF